MNCWPNPHISYQFPDRLFDRDTLLLSRYNVNFLFVTALYARNNVGEKEAWRNKAREKFRSEIQKVLEKKYKFYLMSPNQRINVKKYLDENFRKLIGKVFTPFENKEILILALQKLSNIDEEKEHEEHEELLEMLKKEFAVQDYKLGYVPNILRTQSHTSHKYSVQLQG